MKFNTILSLALALLFVSPHTTLAQQATETAATRWAGVRLVPPGDELVVILKDGRSVNGRIISSSDDAIIISRKDKTATLDRAGVQKVYRKVPRSGITRTQIGTLGGLGAGAAVGAALSSNEDVEAAWTVPIFALIGAGIGALIGAVSGSNRVKVLIYEAK